MFSRFIAINKHTLIYGAALASLLFLLKWLELRYMVLTHAQDIFIGSIAVIFTGLGIWLATRLARPKIETVVVEKEVIVEVPQPVNQGSSFAINAKALEKFEISSRELEVLQLMAKGLSNQEIADQMFVSLNTVKTHSSNLFLKLDVKRRTQAVDKARQTGIIP